MASEKMKGTFIVKSFSQLSLDELHRIFILRQKVFVVEQDCAYLDADGLDEKAMHLFFLSDDSKLAAYSRILPAGLSYPDHVAIGRVVVDQEFRRAGLGRDIMTEALSYINEYFPAQKIKISAQCYLEAFYQSLGFKQQGESYLEDGIPHIAMTYNPK
jgi:ElaA protein